MPVFESEEELESALFEYPSLVREQLNIPGKLFRQVRLFEYGIADLVSVAARSRTKGEVDFLVTIIELKKGAIDHNAVEQVAGYMKAVEEHSAYHCYPITVAGCLIGSKISSGVQFISDVLLRDIKFCTYEINPLNGLILERQSGWHLKNSNPDIDTEKIIKLEELAPMVRGAIRHRRKLEREQQKEQV